MSLKKKGPKHKSNGSFLKADFDNINDNINNNDNDIRKLIKGRNGNKRNGMLNV